MNESVLPCPICGKPPEVTIGKRASNGEWYAYPTIQCRSCDYLKHGHSDELALARWNTRPQAVSTAAFSGTVTSNPDWQALHQQQLDRNVVLTSLLERCLPIVQSDADMASSISRHAPLDPESQARHDNTETESEKLLPDIAAYLRATTAEYSKKSAELKQAAACDPVARATTLKLLDALSLIKACQEVLTNHLPSDGTTAAETINQLLGLLDGPRSREVLAAPLPTLAGACAVTCVKCGKQLPPMARGEGVPRSEGYLCSTCFFGGDGRKEPELPAPDDTWMLLSLAVHQVKDAAHSLERGAEHLAHAAKIKNKALSEASGCLKLLYRDKPDSIVVTVNEVLDRIEEAKKL